MLQISSLCDHQTYDQTGAARVTIIFLSVFVVLIFGDAVLTAYALRKALTKDERISAFEKQAKEKKSYLQELNKAIDKAENHAQHVCVQPVIVQGMKTDSRRWGATKPVATTQMRPPAGRIK